MSDLYVPLSDGELSLVPLCEEHREFLRSACDEDSEIWEIYPVSYRAEHFDPNFNLMLLGFGGRRPYAIFQGEEIVGMTAWLEHGLPGHSIEIGNSYIVPRLRGTGFNTRLKKLMLDHAFSCGLMRVAFKVDEVNKRSQAAVLKLGCTQEGVMRAERVTWTGRIRHTVLFSILADEWRTLNA
jgi:RimJ/RimL family protein N-acetyltransferase